MSRAMDAHVNYKSLRVSLPSSAQKHREMTKLCFGERERRRLIKKHSLWDRTYLWSPYEGAPTPRDRSIQRVKGRKMRFPNETEKMWSLSLLQSGKKKSVIIYPVRRLVQSRAISINLLVNLPVSIKIIHAHYLTQALCKLCHCNLNY